jgi:hypothetical protein
VQAVDPGADAVYPGGHGTHALPAVGAMRPAGHAAQLAAPVGEDIPGAQGVHAVEPGLAAYCPAGHATHCAVPMLGATYPAWHAVHAAAPRPEYVPAGHCMQLLAPAGAYIPGLHWMHLPPMFTDPAAQRRKCGGSGVGWTLIGPLMGGGAGPASPALATSTSAAIEQTAVSKVPSLLRRIPHLRATSVSGDGRKCTRRIH